MTHRRPPRLLARTARLAGALTGLGLVFTLVGVYALAIGNGPNALLVGLAVTALSVGTIIAVRHRERTRGDA
jgi:hypothetical protein